MAQPVSSILGDVVKSSRSIAHSDDFEGHKLIQTNSRQLILLDLNILYWCPASRDQIKPLLVQPQISCNASGLASCSKSYWQGYDLGWYKDMGAPCFPQPNHKSMAGAMCINVVDSSQEVCCHIHPGITNWKKTSFHCGRKAWQVLSVLRLRRLLCLFRLAPSCRLRRLARCSSRRKQQAEAAGGSSSSSRRKQPQQEEAVATGGSSSSSSRKQQQQEEAVAAAEGRSSSSSSNRRKQQQYNQP